MRISDKILSGLGSTLEWYDFSIYAYFAAVISQQFFPNNIFNNGLLFTFSVFAIGFLARPVGALIFGSISDTYGRCITLQLTPYLITIPTVLLSLLPTYHTIGIAAPIILTLIRIIQGICIGGEYATNITFLCESSKRNRVYFMGSLGSCTASFGIFIASTVAALSNSLLSKNSLLTWGWRSALFFSLPIGLLTIYFRRNIKETDAYKKINLDKSIESTMNPINRLLKYSKLNFILAFALTLLPSTAFYYVFTFLPSFLSYQLNHNSYKTLITNSISLLSRFLIIPALGLLADRIGGIKIARLSSLLFILSSYALLSYIIQDKYVGLCAFIFGMLTSLNAATTPGLLVELITPHTRCTTIALTLNISFGVFGGLVPVICLYLTKVTNNNLISIFYLITTAIITLIATFYFEKRQLLNEQNL